ncbi:MAG: Transcriptional regulator SlyA [Pseudidiomarina mangrovi]|nr:MAG: Transcriptional regulator SlyA [Pseudidiomarina mangrovi]
MNKINQIPELLARAEQQWSTIYPQLAVTDAALIGLIIGVGANADYTGLLQLKPFGLQQTEHDVLACARRQPPPHQVKPSQLLDEVRITSGALTTCINRLIEKGLVTRISSAQDQRSKPLQLTAQGCQLIESLTQSRFQTAGQLMAVFSTDEKAQLKQLLLKFQQQLAANFNLPLEAKQSNQ